MEKYGHYSKLLSAEKLQIYTVELKTREILKIFKELISNPNLATHYSSVDKYDYIHHYKRFESIRALVNINKTTSNEKQQGYETDASGCDKEFVTRIVPVDRYSFDLLNEEATILYNLLMRLELNDYDAIPDISAVYSELLNRISELEEAIKNKRESLNAESDDTTVTELNELITQRNNIKNGDIFKYYQLLSTYITCQLCREKSVQELEEEIEEAERTIERNELLLKRRKNKTSNIRI